MALSQLPISEYALLSDSHTAALVSRGGSVDWLCFPRFDSPAIFGRLLDDTAGHWTIRPAGEARVSRQYVERALVLQTCFETAGGKAIVTDALAVGPNERGHELGARAPHALLRQVRGIRGEVEIEIEYAPRPEYGIVIPLLVPVDGALLARGGAAVLFLSSPVTWEVTDSTAHAQITIREGEILGLALQYRSSSDDALAGWGQEEIASYLEETVRAWQSWSDIHQSYQGPWKDLVHQSGRVLQGLTYFPTGAMVAAATTSLPEQVGGERNWDYRFCWVRDASFTLEALWVAACPDEAHKFFDFLSRAAVTQVRRGLNLQIMFGIGGEHDLTERELSHLSGWRASRPVRIGNGAWNQRQLDVYGETLGAVYRLRDRLAELDDVTREFLIALVDTAGERWRERDQGIWEVRSEPRHFLYSKLMCWVALNQGIRLADVLNAHQRVEKWTATREEIRRTILEEGWNQSTGAFTQSFGDEALDASTLVMPMVGFLPAKDPRMRATIDAIAEQLTDSHGLVYRYLASDGLKGEEGTFLLCTFWLAEALALAGEVARARKTFEAAAECVNDLGLLSEEVDPTTGELIGNFPQAFSHIGLVNAAWAIAQAEEGKTTQQEVQDA
jgi:GH15 family glucan-1,4-alpha-glucosidase